MNIAAQITSEQPAGVHIANDDKVLGLFLDPGCSAAIWQRDLPADAISWLAQLDPNTLPNARVVIQATAVGETVEQFCRDAGMPTGPHRDWLVGDIAALAKRFAALMDVPYLRLRLQAITTNACRKFHLDAITGRLVCTYRGAGTQYGTAQQGSDPTQIFDVPTGVPILLRGSLWPAKPATGLLHRSPPIEGTGETRLVLVLDPISDLGDAE